MATKTRRNIYTTSQQVKTPQLETGQHIRYLKNGAEHHRTKQGPPWKLGSTQNGRRKYYFSLNTKEINEAVYVLIPLNFRWTSDTRFSSKQERWQAQVKM